MADLPSDHMLTLNHGKEYEEAPERPPTAQCNYGSLIALPVAAPVSDAAFKMLRAAANVQLWDTYNAALDAGFSKALGWDINGPAHEANFTGLLDALGET